MIIKKTHWINYLMTIFKIKKQIILISLLSTKVLLAQSLSTIVVNGEKNTNSTNISSEKIDSKEIKQALNGNGFISSLLEDNPNVKITDISNNSSTAGEITPGKISFHGAAFYQNNFQVDGISNNSLIDPSSSLSFSNAYDVPGNENESFIDLDLIKSIEIYDSNISAEYGHFTGGVIDVKTIRAGNEPSYKLSYKYTSDSLTNFHIDKSEKNNFEDAVSDNFQPRFKKTFYNMYISTPIDEKNGIIFSYARKESIIPGAYLNTFKDKSRLNQNLMLKYSHYFDNDAIIDLTANYSPYESTHFEKDVKDSDTKIKGGGFSLKTNYEKNFNFWALQSNLGLKFSENSKDSSDSNKQWLAKGSKNWNNPQETVAKEGGSGTIDKEQKGINYNLKLNSNDFKTGDINHKLKTGLDLNFDTVNYNRKKNTYYYTNPNNITGIICNGDNTACDDNYQYLRNRRVYQAEDLSVDMFSSSFYLEDKLEYKYFEFTPGIRVDYNDYLKNIDIAHRLNSSIKPFGDNKTIIFGGINRYYGKSFLGHKLREARIPYYEQYRGLNYPAPTNWTSSTFQDSSKYVFSNLETPYSDEYSIGLRKDISFLRFNLKHVKRESKNEFISEYGKAQIYDRGDGEKAYFRPLTFTNGGSSKSDTTSLIIMPIEESKFSWGSLSYKFSTALSKSKYNLSSYDNILDDENNRNYGEVYYNGKVVNTKDVSSSDTPKSYNLELLMTLKPFKFFDTNVSTYINNSFTYNSSYKTIANTKETRIKSTSLGGGFNDIKFLDVYEDDKMEANFIYDLKLAFDFKLKDKHHLHINTEINNVFDEVANLENQRNSYKTGRQFWFEIAYKY